MRELPQGQPEAGDRGLDRTPTWGRTYWGGALFFFLADLDIREHSKGQMTLMDALRRIHQEGLNTESTCELPELLAALDRGAGRSTFRALHDRHGAKAEKVDLEAIWARLGLQVKDGKVRFLDDAPAAYLRRAWIGAIR
jgi:predicted metalloprotease with PDZ domain